MTSDVIKSIGSGARDFTTLASYITYVNAVNLIGTDTRQIGELYNDSEFVVSGSLGTITNATVDATRYILLRAAAGQGFKDAAGVRTNALYYNASNGVGLRTTGSSQLLSISSAFVVVDGLQFSGGYIQSNVDHITIQNSILGGGVYINGATVFQFTNDLIYSLSGILVGGNAIIYLDASGTCTINDCDVISPTGAGATYGINNTSAGSFTVENAAIFGATNASTGTGSFTTSMTDATGTTGLTGSKTFANQFTSTTNDFRVKAGADLIGAGTPIGGITTDISGFTRSATTPTIGCWEFASAGAAPASSLPLIGIGKSLVPVSVPIWYAERALRQNNPMTRRRLLSGINWLKK